MTPTAYHKLVQDKCWLTEKANRIWKAQKSHARGWKLLLQGWHSMGIVLCCRRIASGHCFFCTTCHESSIHSFLARPLAKQVWRFISKVLVQVTRDTDITQKLDFCKVNGAFELIHVFHYFRWTGLWHTWHTHNAFIFYGTVGITIKFVEPGNFALAGDRYDIF